MNVSDFIKPISGLKYYVPMIDYEGRIGMGANCAPEYSRRQVVEEIRDAIGSGHPIIHVKFIDGNDMSDVTEEIIRDALDENYNPGLVSAQDLIDARHDHARDIRKHEVA